MKRSMKSPPLSFCLRLVVVLAMALGSAAMALDPSNTALGNGAPASVATGVNFTALGYRARNFNSTGYQNSATGAEALSDNDGYNNTATGYAALLLD